MAETPLSEQARDTVTTDVAAAKRALHSGGYLSPEGNATFISGFLIAAAMERQRLTTLSLAGVS